MVRLKTFQTTLVYAITRAFLPQISISFLVNNHGIACQLAILSVVLFSLGSAIEHSSSMQSNLVQV